MKRFSMPAFVLVFACLAGLAICRGDELAAVTGLVTDPNGRSVPGVTVIITNLGTNIASRTVTNDQGIYRVPSLQPGIYRMTLDKDGFKSIVKSGVELHGPGLLHLEPILHLAPFAIPGKSRRVRQARSAAVGAAFILHLETGLLVAVLFFGVFRNC